MVVTILLPSLPPYKFWAWGDNTYGQLGTNNTTAYSSPVQVGALTTWATTGGIYNFTIAIKTDGTLWSWGLNGAGQLGLGDTTTRSSPVQVGALTTWSIAKGGGNMTIAIKTDGTAWSFGQNNRGQLGNSPSYPYPFESSPVQIGALTTWSGIACGDQHTISTRTDGTLWSWGYNDIGQLGIGSTSYKTSPVQIGALTTWTVTGAGPAMGFAIAEA